MANYFIDPKCIDISSLYMDYIMRQKLSPAEEWAEGCLEVGSLKQNPAAVFLFTGSNLYAMIFIPHQLPYHFKLSIAVFRLFK